MKIAELEDRCFKLQNELDECKSELLVSVKLLKIYKVFHNIILLIVLFLNVQIFRTTYKSESERWKELAAERLTKMEQLNSQLEERHCHEVTILQINSKLSV